jgi:glycosyltransferase involved in cell wall biosynthesis/SAM-dependent methyltransferase
MTDSSTRPRVCFIVESGTDVRLVEGLGTRVALQVLARGIPGGRPISQPTAFPVSIASSGRLTFAWRAFTTILRSSTDAALVQGHGIAALAVNVAARIKRVPCWMLICSPAAEYYEARRTAGQSFSQATLGAIRLLARINGSVGQGYVVLSQYLRAVVRESDPRHPVHIIPVYGVDLAHFSPAANRARAREARGLPAAGAIIFNSSRVAPEKDVLTLIDALKALLAEGRDVYLLNRSGGFREFLGQAQRAGVGQRVIATDAADPRRELPLDYASADVCVQASRAEGLGFSVLEALACGTPVVATAVGGLVETVQDGVTGWTVPPGNAAALASALRDALDHPEEARRRAAAGRKLVQTEYESNAAFDALAALLGANPSPVPRTADPGLRTADPGLPGSGTPDSRTALEHGPYYRKQLGCGSSVIAWSHRSRFEVGLGLIGAAPRTLLDYGCGDGTFLAMAANRIGTGCGADIDAGQTDEARRRLAAFTNLQFCTIPDLSAPAHSSAYDVVTCMETLEHCTEDVVQIVLRDLARLVAPGGRVIISVPIETGPTFLLKLLVRTAAAWRGLSDYRYYESYSAANAWRMIFAGRRGPIARPVYGGDSPYHSHYGFNWKALREKVGEHLAIEATHFSPLGFSRGLASSQAWFVCRPTRST